ncbi:hypothetical protein GCM10023160_05470 [Brachybacterium paraconglomeratum]
MRSMIPACDAKIVIVPGSLVLAEEHPAATRPIAVTAASAARDRLGLAGESLLLRDRVNTIVTFLAIAHLGTSR